MEDLKQLKTVLRSLAVSSPVQMTITNLLRDYRNMMGCPLPITKYGYRDPLQFLKDRCGDCFLFQGYGMNTVLVPIVPDSVKHIDAFVQKQKVSSKMKYKGKRRSINESAIRPPHNPIVNSCEPPQDLIVKSFESNCRIKTETPNSMRDTPNSIPAPQRNPRPRECNSRQPEIRRSPTPNIDKSAIMKHSVPKPVDNNVNKYKSMSNISEQNKENRQQDHSPPKEAFKNRQHHSPPKEVFKNRQQDHSPPSKEAFKNFMRNRLPVYDSMQELNNENKSNKDSESSSSQFTRTLSSSSSTKAVQLEELKGELLQLIRDSPNGVYTVDIMKLYRERYGRELNFSRFGFSSVSVLACGLEGVFTSRDALGNTRVTLAPVPEAPHARRQVPRPKALRPVSVVAEHATDEDALPWIDFDPDVFPEDCMSFSESIPSPSLEGVMSGAMLEVMVGEVYSPSHFWLYRLGEQYNIAMEDMMDEMTHYYTLGEGAQRTLAAGAVRVGHYCSSVFERDWHRSLIVKIVDSETVKVRHVDYGTVDRVAVSKLKPLLRRWGSLPAQAVRARLAGACPAARGRRWPHAAAAAFLRLVQDRRLVANVAHVDREENIVELFLIDTSTDRDVLIDQELIRAGHADCRPSTDYSDTAVPSYLYPRFDALESGDTPNFADIHAYLRDGISLEYVEDYSRHVPPALPPDPPHPAVSTPAPLRKLSVLDNRIPLIPRSLVDTAVVAPCVYDIESSSEEEYILAAEESSDYEQPGETQHACVENETQTSDQLIASNDLPSEEDQEEEAKPATPPLPSPPAPASVPAPAPVSLVRVESAPRLEESQVKTKPACRAAPRTVPDIRALHRPDNRSHPFLGQSLMSAPSMQPLPFFVFPPPNPPLPPYPHPSYPMPPAFSPRPYPPPMDGFYPPRNYQQYPSMRAHYTGPSHGPAPPPFSSGPVYSSYPPEPPRSYHSAMSHTYRNSSAPASNASTSSVFTFTAPTVVSTTPATMRPILGTRGINPAVSSTPFSKPPVSWAPLSKPPVSSAPVSTVTGRPVPAPVVTASVAPTPIPAGVEHARQTSSHSPPPPYNGGPRRISTGHGEVTLTVSECEIFNLLSSVDPNAAHWYMVDAISRAMATRTTDAAQTPIASNAQAANNSGSSNSSRLNPEAHEFRATTIRPPPGFGGD